jgi:hypothetical protein
VVIAYFFEGRQLGESWEAFYYQAAHYWHASHQATLWLKEALQARAPWLPGAVLSGFTAINSIRTIAYVPQILKAARDTNGASAISYTTWLLFLASHLMTIAYAIICIGDLLMAIIFLGNALACLAIVSVAAFNVTAIRHLVNLKDPWRAIREAAGLDDVRIHDLRHSFASVGVAGGTRSFAPIGHQVAHDRRNQACDPRRPGPQRQTRMGLLQHLWS